MKKYELRDRIRSMGFSCFQFSRGKEIIFLSYHIYLDINIDGSWMLHA